MNEEPKFRNGMVVIVQESPLVRQRISAGCIAVANALCAQAKQNRQWRLSYAMKRCIVNKIYEEDGMVVIVGEKRFFGMKNEEPKFRIYETIGNVVFSWEAFFVGQRFGMVAIIIEESL